MTVYTVDVLDADGSPAGTVDLPEEIFGVQTNVPLIHQVVVAQLAAARQGSASTKTRGEVSGGGRKPYRQKGTGRARQGSIRAPQFAGGGVVHGPTPRSYEQRTPKKMKAAALRGALSDRARHGRVHVVEGFASGGVPSTKAARSVLATVAAHTASLAVTSHAGTSHAETSHAGTSGRNVLVVLARGDEVAWRSLRNLTEVHLLAADQLNTYDVLCSDEIIFTRAAIEVFLAGPVTGKGHRAAAAIPARPPAPTEPVDTEPVEADRSEGGDQ